MKNMFSKLPLAICASLLILGGAGCNNSSSVSTGYDGKVFDISLAQDNSIKASIKKIGKDFELTISGSGEAMSYEKKELVPWNAISKKITKVTIEEGIKNIGDYYFNSLSLSTYLIPASVTKVEKNSFNSSAEIYSHATENVTINCENNFYLYSETKPSVYGEYWHYIGDTIIIWDIYKMLFIGNSFTFYPNDLFSVDNPAVCALSKEIGSSLGIDLEIDFVVKGSHTLKKFANKNDEMGKIVDEKLNSSSDYDYIILQEQSTTPVNDYNSFKSGVESLLAKIETTQTDSEVYLYETWGYPSAVSSSSIFSSVKTMEGLLRDAYKKCATECGVKVTNVGQAFTEVYENHPEINLYGKDDKHQAYTGAYLSSCVHIANIFGVDVREATFKGELDEKTANTLKETAYKVVFE